MKAEKNGGQELILMGSGCEGVNRGGTCGMQEVGLKWIREKAKSCMGTRGEGQRCPQLWDTRSDEQRP